MSTQVQVEGGSADRFRAYVEATMTRPPSLENHLQMAKLGKAFKPGQKVTYKVHEVAIDSPVSGTAVHIDTQDVITHVVFYAGLVESEVVVGSVVVNAAGPLDIELVAPEGEPENVSEDELKAA